MEQKRQGRGWFELLERGEDFQPCAESDPGPLTGLAGHFMQSRSGYRVGIRVRRRLSDHGAQDNAHRVKFSAKTGA
jgi:hypothetical protein